MKGWLLKSAFFTIFVPMLTDFRLKVFHTVAQLRNFTKAARELNISQPAVSQNIAELEQQIGDTLVDRKHHGISLTPKGEILFEYAEKILHLYESLNSELIPTNTPRIEELRIAACPIAVRFILPKVISRFQALYPTIEVSMLERQDSDIEGTVLEGVADLGVMESTPKKLSTAPFANLSLSESSEPMLRIVLAFSPESQNQGAIQKFVLTAKTAL